MVSGRDQTFFCEAPFAAERSGAGDLRSTFLGGFWAVLGGISLLAAAWRLRKEIEDEWFLALSGLLTLIFGLLLLLYTVVQLTANPATNYAFSTWSGDVTGSANPASVTMSANRSVTAGFQACVALTTAVSPVA